MILSIPQYSSLKSRLKNKYTKDLALTKKALKRFPDLKIKNWIDEDHEELKTYSSLNWFFLKQIQLLLSFLSADLPKKTSEDGFTETEDLIFEKWNQSEFAETFLKLISKGYSVKKANDEASKIFDAHLIALAERHILRSKISNKHYRLQTSLGDTGIKTKLLETTLHLDKKELRLMTSSMKEMKEFSHRIEDALKIIKKVSPTSWDRFKSFTDVIIPIKEQEFVSYSHQELPGTSMINMYHRDFVDLLDDLLHENGHHHLNYYLNLGKLIDEPIETIYYSPWRRTLRPIRGIYHAYFTFFWAFKLFSDLANEKKLDDVHSFNAKEKEKIIWRAIEEYWMLEYVYQDLVWAKKQGLIKATGWKLIEAQKNELNKFKKKIPMWEKKLKVHKKDLNQLKKVLKEARKDYKLV